MANGVVTGATVTSFSVTTVCLIIVIALSIKNARSKEDKWKDSKTDRSIQKFTIAALYLFSIAVFLSWVLFLETLTIGYDTETFDVIPTVTLLLFMLPFLIALMFTLYIWIKRAEYAFQGSEYAFSPRFIQFMHLLFLYAVCIFGAIAIIIYGISKVITTDALSLLRKVLGGLWAIMFVTEIFVVLYAYLSKLSHLKHVCANVVTNYDANVAQIMSNLVATQIKLSILLVTLIAVTFLAILGAIVLEAHIQFFPLSINAFIGFICVMCSIPGHRDVYHRACVMCMWCCFQYTRPYQELMVLRNMSDHEAVPSKTGDVGTTTKQSAQLSVTTASAKRESTGDEQKPSTPTGSNTDTSKKGSKGGSGAEKEPTPTPTAST